MQLVVRHGFRDGGFTFVVQVSYSSHLLGDDTFSSLVNRKQFPKPSFGETASNLSFLNLCFLLFGDCVSVTTK